MTYIITADRDKGKTTYLENLVKQQPEYFGGILSLAGPNKDSYFAYNIESKEKRLLMSKEEGLGAGPVIKKFHCKQENFDWAKGAIEASQKPAIIIDEIGRLELRDEGFASVLRLKLKSSQELYLAVRSSFVEEVIEHFGIKEYRVIEVGCK